MARKFLGAILALSCAFTFGYSATAPAQVQATKKATPGTLGGNWYGSLEVRHHANAYYDAQGNYQRVDPSMHVRAQFGAQFYDGLVDTYATLGIFKETQTQQILQRQPEIAVDLYPWKSDHVQVLQYNFVQLPVRKSNTSQKQADEESVEEYNPSTVYTVGLAPTFKLPLNLNGTKLDLKAGADGWTRLYSRRQFVEGQQSPDSQDDEDDDGRLALQPSTAGPDGEPIEDYAMHYQAQTQAGFELSPAIVRAFSAETTAHYHSRFTPIYTRSESGGTGYNYFVDRYSYARVRLKYDFTDRLALTNDFYAYHDGLFAGDRKGEDRRYRNVVRMSCRL